MNYPITHNATRVLICTVGGVPHKTTGASVVLFYQYIQKFKEMGFSILHLLILDKNHPHRDVEEYDAEMRDSTHFDILVNTVDHYYQYAVSGRGITIRFPDLPDDIINNIRRYDPQLVFCFDITAASILINVTSRANMAWIGDLQFQTIWYHALYSVKENVQNVVKLPVAYLKCHLWKRVYKNTLAHYRSVVVASKSSESVLSNLGIHSQYLPYPWPVADSKSISESKPDVPSFLFFGTLVALGSRSAFHYLIRSIYPESIAIFGRGRFQILICGLRELPEWVAAELATRPEIIYLGYVDDIHSLIASSHAVIVPIDIPVGNRSRIITAMAHGGLVIAHSNTALSNPDLAHSENCFLADDPRKFVEYMALAFSNPVLSASIIRNARTTYENTFHPDEATRRMADEIKRVLIDPTE